MNTLKMINLLAVVLLASFLSAGTYKEDDTFTEKSPFILMDFSDFGSDINNLDGIWEVFDNPNDNEAYIHTKYIKDVDLHKIGFYLKINYSVRPTLPAFAGILSKLNGVSLTNFQALSLTIRGDKKSKFSDTFKIEFKDGHKQISSMVEGISSEWKTIVIPFEEFSGDTIGIDMSQLKEFVIVFEDWAFQQKVGAYYLDDISFIPKKGVTIKYADMLAETVKNKEGE